MPKLPWPPTAEELLASDTVPEIVGHTMPLWRIHFNGSRHPVAWNVLRHYGPVESCRFDPHPPPRSAGQPEGVAYLAADIATALAEVFQETRVIATSRNSPWLSGFTPSRPLRLLDLRGQWPVRAGASHTINTGRKDHCRAWARTIRAAWPELDGLAHSSAMTSTTCVTLFNPAEDAFPDQPEFSAPLTHPELVHRLARAARQIGYDIF